MKVKELINQLQAYDEEMIFSVCADMGDVDYSEPMLTNGFDLIEQTIYLYDDRVYTDEIELFDDLLEEYDADIEGKEPEEARIFIDRIIKGCTKYPSLVMHLNNQS